MGYLSGRGYRPSVQPYGGAPYALGGSQVVIERIAHAQGFFGCEVQCVDRQPEQLLVGLVEVDLARLDYVGKVG